MIDYLTHAPLRYRSYDALQRRVENIIRRSGNTPRICFSMYRNTPEDAGRVVAWDFRNRFEDGWCIFYTKIDDEPRTYLPVITPTWEDVIVVANTLAGKDRRHLDGVIKRANKRFEIVFG